MSLCKTLALVIQLILPDLELTSFTKDEFIPSNNMSDNRSISTSYKSLDSKEHFNKYECEECSQIFTSRYNLERHNRNFHNAESSGEEDMETDDESNDEDTNESDVEDTNESDVEDSDEENTNVPKMFHTIFWTVVQTHEDEIEPLVDEYTEDEELSQTEAIKKAFLENKEMKRALLKMIKTSLINAEEFRRDPLIKSIQDKAKDLKDEGFARDEALTTAIKYRKYAIYNWVKSL